jgi:MFS family permease
VPADPPARSGRFVAAAAILVTAPRLALTFLGADGIPVPPAMRVALLALTSVSTAVALTGGAAYLSLAIGREVRGRLALLAFWTASIVCSSALIAPAIVAGLRASPLASVLPGPVLQWAWAIGAVAAVDLIAAGAMRADARQAAASRDTEEALAAVVRELEQQRDEARRELQLARREPHRPRARKPRQAAPAPVTAAELSCPRCGAAGFRSRKALSGHQRWCRTGGVAPRPSAPATAPL